MQTAEAKDRLQAKLNRDYDIKRPLDGAGMASVFLAWERALGRDVVVKFFSLERSPGVRSERFAREIRLAAGLQQANIVPLLTAGTADGMVYYTMPYVEGRSLLDRLQVGPIPLAEAMNVLRDVARALAFAHSRGVVHRDIKPGNILLSGGTAVVTDFGIAKAIDEAWSDSTGESDAPAGDPLTGASHRMGTPRYMAPEQCIAAADVDYRADIYAWGVLAYELLANRHPFAHCHTAAALIAAQIAEMPAPLLEANPDCPRDMAALVMRCLAKNSDDRPENAEELVHAFQHQGVVHGTASTTGVAAQAHDVPSVAVLPFINSGGDPNDEFFADGVTEEILSALAHERGIRVAARTSCFAFKGRAVDLREAADRLGVRTVLEGSVRRVGMRLRVMTQLISAEDGLTLWSASFDREMADVLQIQAEIAQAIVQTLGAALRDSLGGPMGRTRKSRLRGQPVGKANVEAYEEYLRGRLHLDQRSMNLASAIGCFERAVGIDPGLSVAHAGLAHTYTWLGLWYVVPAPAAFAKVSEAAGRALAIDPTDPVAVSASAVTALWHDWDWAKAERLAWRATDLAPGLPLGHSVMTYVRISDGDAAGAIASAERAALLDPLSTAAKTDLADALRFGGRHEEARSILEPVLRREPEHLLANLWMAYQLEILGDLDGAIAYVERAAAAAGRGPALVAAVARQLAAAGRIDQARAVVAELHDRRQGEYVAPFVMAVANVGLGDNDATIRYLSQAVAARDPHVIHLHLEHFWAPLHHDSRFVELVRSVGMARTH